MEGFSEDLKVIDNGDFPVFNNPRIDGGAFLINCNPDKALGDERMVSITWEYGATSDGNGHLLPLKHSITWGVQPDQSMIPLDDGAKMVDEYTRDVLIYPGLLVQAIP